MAAFAHVGFGRERINAGWANNGADDLLTFNALNMLVGSQIAPQLLVGSFVLDGVLERHPRLVVVVEEVGIDWLPHLVTTLELMVGRTPEVLHDGEYRPGNLERGGYRLPLTPTEYLRRQVRVSPLPASQPIAGVLEQVPRPARVLQRLSARGGHGRRGGDLRTPAQGRGCSCAQLVLRGRRRSHRRVNRSRLDQRPSAGLSMKKDASRARSRFAISGASGRHLKPTDSISSRVNPPWSGSVQ